jgi:hypothetical protein
MAHLFRLLGRRFRIPEERLVKPLWPSVSSHEQLESRSTDFHEMLYYEVILKFVDIFKF